MVFFFPIIASILEQCYLGAATQFITSLHLSEKTGLPDFSSTLCNCAVPCAWVLLQAAVYKDELDTSLLQAF